MNKHEKIRRSLTSVNVLDESIYEEKRRQRRYKIPMYIFLMFIFLASVAIAAGIYFRDYVMKISFFNQLDLYKKLLDYSSIAYIAVAGVLALIIVLYLVTMLSGTKELRNLNRELASEEENLTNLLGLVVNSDDDHEYVEEAIKAALQVQEQEYDRAKDFMDNLERRSKDDEKYHTRVEQLTQEISYAKAAIDSLIRQVKSYEDYEVLKEESARLGEKIEILQRKYDALQLARTVLSESFEKWQSDLGPVFAKTARTILYDITKGRHENMKIDRDFEISLPDNSTGRLYPSGYFSGATIDQMYLALRLALVKLISSDTVAFPVIFDDPFVQYDKTRRLSAIEVLSRFAENNETQVIITACVRDDYPENVNVINL